MAKDSIRVTIGARDEASGVLDRISARAVAFGVFIGNLGSRIAAGAMNGFRTWINEAVEAEKANVRLDAVLRASGQFTPELARRFRDLANAIQDETGASDEAVKANIAMGTALGVGPGQMEAYARGVQALTALQVEGTMAARAMARALEGDFEAFNRLSPAVRLATGETAKAEAVSRFLLSGLEQQRANLNTVGGAWEALKGRIGDAREELIGAIFEGVKLGKTFNAVQATLGAFLKSDTFARFTGALRDGAAYAVQIAKAMTADGGTKAVAVSLGNVILAALKDGADYVGNQIKNALGAGKVSGAAKFYGALSAGAGIKGAVNAMSAPDAAPAGGKGGRLGPAIASLDAAIRAHAAAVDARAAEEEDRAVTDAAMIEEQRKREELEAQFDRAISLAKERQANAEGQKAALSENTLATQRLIESLTQREAAARSKVARNQERLAALAGQGLAGFIANAKEQAAGEQERQAVEKKQVKRLDSLKRKLGMDPKEDLSNLDTALEQAGKRGIHLSPDKLGELKNARDFESKKKAANDAMINGRNEQLAMQKAKKAAEDHLRTLQERATTALENIEKKIDGISDAN